MIIESGIESRHDSVASNCIEDEVSAITGGIDPNCVKETDPCDAENTEKDIIHEPGDKKTEGKELQTEVDGSEQTEVKVSSCANCFLLKSENRQLRNKVKTLREKRYERRNDHKKTKRLGK